MSHTNYGWHADARHLARSALARGAHALLLAGARGLGKRELALSLAAACLCHSRSTDGRACEECESCRWFAAGTHPDFAMVEAAGGDDVADPGTTAAGASRTKAIGVDQIRQLTHLLSLSAHRSAGKVVIIHPAEGMNLAAANALLKNLEEPPPAVVFLLVSDRPALLPATVRSRCQTVPVRIGDKADAQAWLAQNAIADPSLHLALSGGAPLEARAIGIDPSWARRRAFLNSLAAEKTDPVRIAETFREVSPALVLAWLQKWTFDLLLMRFCGKVRYHIDLEPLLAQVALRLRPIEVTRLHRALLAFQRHANHPLNPRLFVEQMLIVYRQALVNEAAP